MTRPKESIELRRDILNLLSKHPKTPTRKMMFCTDPNAQKILKVFEDKGLIDVDTSEKTHKRELTKKGRVYMKAFNDFSTYLDIL